MFVVSFIEPINLLPKDAFIFWVKLSLIFQIYESLFSDVFKKLCILNSLYKSVTQQYNKTNHSSDFSAGIN